MTWAEYHLSFTYADGEVVQRRLCADSDIVDRDAWGWMSKVTKDINWRRRPVVKILKEVPSTC